ncbi:MAG: hypothetical protein NVS9B2_29470 [Steroidobacteraceae bacterium]
MCAANVIVCDGLADNTAQVQAAINNMRAAGGTLVLDTCKVGALTYAASNNYLTVIIRNKLTLLGTLAWPDLVQYEGDSGGTINQFQIGQAAAIVSPPGAIPTILGTGAASHTMKNLSIGQCAGACIKIDGATGLGALYRLDNVTALSAPVSTGIPLLIDAAFWVWAEHCSFLAQAPSYPASVRITSSTTAFSSAGLIYLKDSMIAGYGVQLDAQTPVSQQGNVLIENTVYEGGRNSFVRVDSSNGTAGGITLRNIQAADAITVPYIVEEFGRAPKGIRAVDIHDSTGIASVPISNVSIKALNLGSSDTFQYSSGWTMGAVQRNYVSSRNGVVDAEWAGAGTSMSPSLVPAATLPVPQDAAQWSAAIGSATVTTAVLGPDGSATAATLRTGSGLAERQIYRASPALSVGDWIVAGVWIKSEDATQPTIVATGNGPLVAFNPGTCLFDGALNYFALDSDPARQVGSAWSALVTAAKVTALPATPELIYGLRTDSTHPTSYWMPWLLRIPAGTMTDADVIRYARFLRNMPSAMPSGGGNMALYGHQKLYFGNDANLYRMAPNTIGTDGQMQIKGMSGPASLPHVCADDKGVLYRCL